MPAELLNSHSAHHGFYGPVPRVLIFAAPRKRITIIGVRDLEEECGDEKELESEAGELRVEREGTSHGRDHALL